MRKMFHFAPSFPHHPPQKRGQGLHVHSWLSELLRWGVAGSPFFLQWVQVCLQCWWEPAEWGGGCGCSSCPSAEALPIVLPRTGP